MTTSALRDHTRRQLSLCVVELLVAFDRYRAYVVPGEPAPPESVEVVERAAARARPRLPEDAWTPSTWCATSCSGAGSAGARGAGRTPRGAPSSSSASSRPAAR